MPAVTLIIMSAAVPEPSRPVPSSPTPPGGADGTAIPEVAPGVTPTRRSAGRRLFSLVGPVVLIAAVIFLVRDSVPSPTEILNALRGANLWWVGGAVVLQSLSVVMLSIQQRGLLVVLGTPVRLVRMVAITLASTAVSLTMPAGGVVGAGWSFRQYRVLGASRAAATTVTVVSGLAGVAGLAALIGLMWSTFRIAHTIAPGDRGVLALCLVLALQTVVLWLAWAAWSWWWGYRARHHSPGPTGPGRRTGQVGPLRQRVRDEIGAAVAAIGHLGRRAWRDATAASIANRLLDAGCLYACCLALGASVNFVELALVYLAIQLVRQIPLTPGGLGVVEVALLAGLTSIGVISAVAAGTVVLYRLIAAWLMVPTGYLALLWIRRTSRDRVSLPLSSRTLGPPLESTGNPE